MKFIILSAVGTILLTISHAAPQPDVSHEDIRDAILSLVNIFRDNSDKLERHEHRERQLGEQLKKALAGLDKRYRGQDQTSEKIVGILKSLEDRIKNVETTIRQRDERERIQLQKSSDAILSVQEALDKIIREMEGSAKGSTAAYTVQGSDKEVIESLGVTLSARIDHLSTVVENHISNRTPTANSQDVTAAITETKRLLQQLQEGSKGGKWQQEVTQGIQKQQLTLDEVLALTTRAAHAVALLPKRQDIEEVNNGTQDILQSMREELIAVSDQSVSRLSAKFEENAASVSKGHDELMTQVSEVQSMAEGFYEDVSKSYGQLLKEVQGLSKIEQVMIQTADNVLDTKRRIEYGVHQILLEVGDLIKVQGKTLSGAVNQRFDDIESTILDNQTGALSNLTSKIATEISQVWRQIGIMYQQLTASADALDRLQQQTDSYVNGSVTTMDSMQDKVGRITSRMSEVDDNLNFLLGRLSLVTSEFNQIKSGLASALDNIRNSFLEVQNEIKDVGPGPRPIKPENQPPAAPSN